jgi:hypothetical protein
MKQAERDQSFENREKVNTKAVFMQELLEMQE